MLGLAAARRARPDRDRRRERRRPPPRSRSSGATRQPPPGGSPRGERSSPRPSLPRGWPRWRPPVPTATGPAVSSTPPTRRPAPSGAEWRWRRHPARRWPSAGGSRSRIGRGCRTRSDEARTIRDHGHSRSSPRRRARREVTEPRRRDQPVEGCGGEDLAVDGEQQLPQVGPAFAEAPAVDAGDHLVPRSALGHVAVALSDQVEDARHLVARRAVERTRRRQPSRSRCSGLRRDGRPRVRRRSRRRSLGDGRTTCGRR